jgi:hypothetical protein
MTRLTAGQKGVTIVIDTGGYSIPDGATLFLILQPGNLSAGAPIVLTGLSVPDNGLFPTYTTTGTDFTASGPGTLWLQVQPLGGQRFTSPPGQVYVYPFPLAGVQL